MTEKRLTKRDKYAMLFAMVADSSDSEKEMLCDFIAHEMDLLAKKDNSVSGADLKRKAEQDAIIAQIESVLADHGEPMTATDIARACECSVQRVSALIKRTAAVRHTEGKQVTFTLN